jgi:recombination protein RecR
MSKTIPDSLQELIDKLNQWPGVGQKTATRYALWLIKQDDEYLRQLAHIMGHIKEYVRLCDRCFNNSKDKICEICADPKREQDTICVVETVQDLTQMESLGEYKGVYHVLGGAIDPMRGMNPEDLEIDSLVKRVKDERIKEVILATNPNIQGDSTAFYIKKLLTDEKCAISILGRGLSIGSNLEYVDMNTLSNALRNRK